MHLTETNIFYSLSELKRVHDDFCMADSYNTKWNICAETDRVDQTSKSGDSGEYQKREGEYASVAVAKSYRANSILVLVIRTPTLSILTHFHD